MSTPLENMPVDRAHGKMIARTRHSVGVYEDGHIVTHEETESINQVTQECCGSGGGCNPVYEICP